MSRRTAPARSVQLDCKKLTADLHAKQGTAPSDNATTMDAAHFAAWTDEMGQSTPTPVVKTTAQRPASTKVTTAKKSSKSSDKAKNMTLEVERRDVAYLVDCLKGNLVLEPRLQRLIFTEIRPDAIGAYRDAVRQGFKELESIIDAFEVPVTSENTTSQPSTASTTAKVKSTTSSRTLRLQEYAAELKIQNAVIETRRLDLAMRYERFEWIIELKDWIETALITTVPCDLREGDQKTVTTALDIVEKLLLKKEPEAIKLEEDAKAFAARKVTIAPAGKAASAARTPRRSGGTAYSRPATPMTPEQQAASEAALAAKKYGAMPAKVAPAAKGDKKGKNKGNKKNDQNGAK